MDPLHPSRRLLLQIAMEVGNTSLPSVRAWIEALRSLPRPVRRSGRFAHTSVVETFRRGRLCGYEVWRHLDTWRNDPKRTKARLWFGRTRNGGLSRALALANAAALRMDRMSGAELREWWDEYRAARSARREVSNLWRAEEPEARVSFSDLQQMSHVYARE